MNDDYPRLDLPRPIPDRIAGLPVRRGYPVPWFVAWLDADGEPVDTGEGEPDFRIIRPRGVALAHGLGKCWICGGGLGAYRAFVIGPMCAVNRTSAEPPSHHECADWSARACPLLTRPHARRRESGLPEGTLEPAGTMLRRNPGVALVWTTRKYRVKHASADGVLFDVGEPEHVEWWAEGREAERAEVVASIVSGLPELAGLASQQGRSAENALRAYVWRAWKLLPGTPVPSELLDLVRALEFDGDVPECEGDREARLAELAAIAGELVGDRDAS